MVVWNNLFLFVLPIQPLFKAKLLLWVIDAMQPTLSFGMYPHPPSLVGKVMHNWFTAPNLSDLEHNEVACKFWEGKNSYTKLHFLFYSVDSNWIHLHNYLWTGSCNSTVSMCLLAFSNVSFTHLLTYTVVEVLIFLNDVERYAFWSHISLVPWVVCIDLWFWAGIGEWPYCMSEAYS